VELAALISGINISALFFRIIAYSNLVQHSITCCCRYWPAEGSRIPSLSEAGSYWIVLGYRIDKVIFQLSFPEENAKELQWPELLCCAPPYCWLMNRRDSLIRSRPYR
jgi:hypothetical protein